MCRVEGNGKAVMPYSVMRGDVKRHDVMRGGTFFFFGGEGGDPYGRGLARPSDASLLIPVWPRELPNPILILFFFLART